jgi:predicted secreted protein
MKKIHSLIAAFFISGIFIMTASANSTTPLTPTKHPKVHFTNPHEPIVTQDGLVTLILKSNPTTGYSWMWDGKDSQKGLTLKSHQYIAPDHSGVMGAPGYEIYVFQLSPSMLTQTNEVHISMTYARPWDKNSGKTMLFTVETKPKLS